MDGYPLKYQVEIICSMDNKKKLLTVLAVILVCCLVYRIMHPYRQETVKKLKYALSSQAGSKKKIAAENEHNNSEPFIMLALLLKPPVQSGKVYNNIFFPKKPEPEKIIQKSKPAQEDINEANSFAGNVCDNLKEFKLFGFFETLGGTALFFKKGRQIFVVRKGDLIDGKYKVEKISKQSISLSVEHIDDLICINLDDF